MSMTKKTTCLSIIEEIQTAVHEDLGKYCGLSY